MADKGPPSPSNNQQLYLITPTQRSQVSGESSKSIFTFMTTSEMMWKCIDYPHDVDDWERNIALLLHHPEWRAKIHEMSVISPQWKILVENWTRIEDYYDEYYNTFGNKAFGKGKCDKLIRGLLSSACPIYQQ